MESTFINSAKLHECQRDTDEWRSCKGYMSKSGLAKIKESPDHYKNGEPYQDTPDKIWGKMYHCFVFEFDEFEKRYYTLDDSKIIISIGGAKPRGTKQYGEWYAEQEHLMVGKEIIKKDDFDRMTAMKDKLMFHPYARMLITNGVAEKGILGTIQTPVGEIGIKLIPDYRKDGKHIVSELKTCADASKEGFQKDAAKYDYHIQAALFSDMVELLLNDNQRISFIFIAQEKKKPFAFNLFEASPQFIGQGRYEYEMLLQLYKYCLDNDKWPGYQVFCPNRYGLLELDLPKWAIRSLDYYTY
jgi:hypothetical protein